MVKIEYNKYIYFYESESEEYLLFGTIDKLGIAINIKDHIEKGFARDVLEISMPNPPVEFYIELGIQLKKIYSK